MSAVQYKGNCDLQRQPEGSITIGDTTTKRVVIKGKKTTLEVLQSTVFMKGSVFEGAWTILSTELADAPGGMAKLTINLIVKGSTTETYPDPVSVIDTWEINWESVEKPIVQCPSLLGAYAGDDTQNEPYRQEIADQVAAWRDSPMTRKRKYQCPKSTLTQEPTANLDADWENLSAEAKKIAQKINKGMEAYLVFFPVITKTQIFSEMPNTGGCGTRNTPSVSIAPYVYLKNGDRAVQQQDKTWQRVQSWKGADTWDVDVYPVS